jgi:sialate O-acetylesterase
MRVVENFVVVDFENIGGGLVAQGGKLEGFAIRGDDGVWYAGHATIDGGKVIVQNEAVSKPAAVRYAWANNPKATLFNKEGLPAGPFRTDKD